MYCHHVQILRNIYLSICWWWWGWMVFHTLNIGILLLSFMIYIFCGFIISFFWGSLVPGWYLCLPNDYKIQYSSFFFCLFPHFTSSARYKYTYTLFFLFFSVLKDEFVLPILMYPVYIQFFFISILSCSFCSFNKEKGIVPYLL